MISSLKLISFFALIASLYSSFTIKNESSLLCVEAVPVSNSPQLMQTINRLQQFQQFQQGQAAQQGKSAQQMQQVERMQQNQPDQTQQAQTPIDVSNLPTSKSASIPSSQAPSTETPSAGSSEVGQPSAAAQPVQPSTKSQIPSTVQAPSAGASEQPSAVQPQPQPQAPAPVDQSSQTPVAPVAPSDQSSTTTISTSKSYPRTVLPIRYQTPTYTRSQPLFEQAQIPSISPLIQNQQAPAIVQPAQHTTNQPIQAQPLYGKQ